MVHGVYWLWTHNHKIAGLDWHDDSNVPCINEGFQGWEVHDAINNQDKTERGIPTSSKPTPIPSLVYEFLNSTHVLSTFS